MAENRMVKRALADHSGLSHRDGQFDAKSRGVASGTVRDSVVSALVTPDGSRGLYDKLKGEGKVTLSRKGHAWKGLSSNPVRGQAIDGAQSEAVSKETGTN